MTKKESKAKDFFSNVSENLRSIFTGRVLTLDFWKRNLFLIFICAGLVIVYMNNRMDCEKDLKQIDSLRKTLINEKYISMITEAELLSNSRIGKIKELIQKTGLPLIEEEEPAYIIRMPQE